MRLKTSEVAENFGSLTLKIQNAIIITLALLIILC
jgi:hypothetical protein